MSEQHTERFHKLSSTATHHLFNHDEALRYGHRPHDHTEGLTQKVGVKDMMIYGLIEMVPIAPFAIYATVYMTSGGLPSLAYLIALIGMILSVLSFGIMIPEFPSSGSIYSYASRTITPVIGFVAGWLMLLQYYLLPDLMFIQAGEALNRYIQGIPVWGFCLLFFVFVLIFSLRSLKNILIINRIALAAQMLVLALFIIFGVVYVIQHPNTSSFIPFQYLRPESFSAGGLMNAVSICAMSFVGFGSIATLTEEARDPKKGPSKAMISVVVLLGLLFIVMTYVASCIDCVPQGGGQVDLMQSHVNTGFYLLAGRVGGSWFGITCAIANALALGVFNALASTSSISRVTYVMSRSGALPKHLGTMDKKTDVPFTATIFVNAVSLGLLFILLAFGMDRVVQLSNFGALASYCIINICVIAWCVVRKKEKRSLLRSFICPALGALITGAIFFSIEPSVALIGWIWVAIGVAYYLISTRIFKKEINLAG